MTDNRDLKLLLFRPGLHAKCYMSIVGPSEVRANDVTHAMCDLYDGRDDLTSGYLEELYNQALSRVDNEGT